MKKNRLFILSSILIIISLFATAAACNLCGVPVEIGETTEEAGAGQQTTEATQGQSQSTEAPTDGNHPPVIEEIELMGMEVEFAASEGYFDELPAPEAEGAELTFTIEASDEDGDELTYSSYDSLGTNFNVNKIDNNNAEFIWILPVLEGSYTLTIEVSDGRGGTDLHSIDMNFTGIASDFGDDTPEEGGAVDFGEAVEESLRGFGVEASISGQVNEDGDVFLATDISGAPSVFVGDTATDIRAYGFLSFDVSEIAGENVLNAWLNLVANRVGEPNTFMSSVFIDSTNYGSTLDPEDFGSAADGLYSRRPGFSDFSFTNDYLKEAVQDDLSEGRQYFQVKIYAPSPSRNGASDGFNFLLSNVSLEVSYN